MDLRLDFPVLLLADATQIPYHCGHGASGEGKIESIEVAYPEHVHGDEPWLRLQTVARVPGRREPSLQALGWQGAGSILHAPGVTSGSLRDAAVRAEHAAAEEEYFGAQTPGPPWEQSRLELDGSTCDLWVLSLENGYFALVADCGAVRLTGDGRQLDAWKLALDTVPAEQAQARMGLNRDDNDKTAGD
jgi:hypothetical protein